MFIHDVSVIDLLQSDNRGIAADLNCEIRCICSLEAMGPVNMLESYALDVDGRGCLGVFCVCVSSWCVWPPWVRGLASRLCFRRCTGALLCPFSMWTNQFDLGLVDSPCCYEIFSRQWGGWGALLVHGLSSFLDAIAHSASRKCPHPCNSQHKFSETRETGPGLRGWIRAWSFFASCGPSSADAMQIFQE